MKPWVLALPFQTTVPACRALVGALEQLLRLPEGGREGWVIDG